MRAVLRGLAWGAAAGLAVLVFGAALGQGVDPVRDEPISPIEPDRTLDPAKVALGKTLFSDVRLSGDDVRSCASCHEFNRGGADGLAHSKGANGQLEPFNTPTVFNLVGDFRLNWRGNHRVLEVHNEAVLLEPRLMNARWPDLLAKLNKDSGIRSAFESAYGAGPSREAVLDALATFQRSLSTPDARFDRYLRGDATAITADEKRGYELFKAYGCIACHQGRNVGGNLFQKFGIFSDPFAGRQDDDVADQGRFAITGRESDRRVFRVPSLRNVALTAPYFHDGSADTLDAAVAIMAQAQLGRTMPQEDRDLIIAFLGTLTGEYEGRPLSQITAAEAR
ncbi:cytochrome c peroxidase [Inquilinus ginsengisoli]|uniref:cytochrome-c peroxidase n=1 Tax=Inquilinus ginsengisoli TaxID=363840 RepID=UPI003D24A226